MSYCLLNVVVLPPTRRIASYTLSYCLLHVVVLPPTRCRIAAHTLSYCLLHVDVACFTDTGFCVVFQRFFSIVFKFRWGDYLKPQTAMLIGTSPVLEMALYTLCFKARPSQDCSVSLARKNFTIRNVRDHGKLRNAYFRISPQ